MLNEPSSASRLTPSRSTPKLARKLPPPSITCLRRVVQVRRARMLHLRRAEARPRQAEVVAVELVAGLLVDAALGAQRLHVEDVHVAHVRLQPLGALAGVADGPDAGVDLAQDVLGHGLVHALDLLHLVVLRQLLAEAELVGQLLHDHVIGARFPQRLDDLLAPLQRAVRRGAPSRRSRTASSPAAGRPRGSGSGLPWRRASPPSPRSRSGTDRSRPAGRACPSPSSSRGRATASSAHGPRRTGRAGCCPGRSARSSRARRRSSATPSCRAWSSCRARTAS